ncbi:MAG: TMEM175 family protein [Sphingomonas sp.]
MSDEAPSEGRLGVGRIEAFSDGVVAIIITIMVLDLHPPVEAGWARLAALWPVFLAYVLSYAYVALYWANHHRLFSHATQVTNALVWSNMVLLFALSLIPVSTAYLGEQHFSRLATWVYLAVLLLPAFAYMWLQRTIRRTGRHDAAAEHYHRQTIRKGAFALVVYVAGLALTFVTPWLGVLCAATVAVFWLLPISPIDRLFGD